MIDFSCVDTSPIPKSFSLTTHYIDGLLTINNARFDRAIENINPSALTHKEMNFSEHRVAYLDRQLEIEEGKLGSLYDKPADFLRKTIPTWIQCPIHAYV